MKLGEIELALISCPECSREFSDTAQSCPNCGFRSGKFAGKSKGIALLLAIFLGGFGIHRFYLGQSGAGILYLLFFWTLIPFFLSLIDIIGLLTKSKDEFGDLKTMNKRLSAEARFDARIDEYRNPPKFLN